MPVAISLFYFYPRSPCGERPERAVNRYGNSVISIHALLAESDPCYDTSISYLYKISIHALLAESDSCIVDLIIPVAISIHALLAESDPSSHDKIPHFNISIHALLAESDA